MCPFDVGGQIGWRNDWICCCAIGGDRIEDDDDDELGTTSVADKTWSL